jgi:hypothetical protein
VVYNRFLECALDAFCDLRTMGSSVNVCFEWDEYVGLKLTLTFFPSSLIAYSTVVTIPFSSTLSSILGLGSSMHYMRHLDSTSTSNKLTIVVYIVCPRSLLLCTAAGQLIIDSCKILAQIRTMMPFYVSVTASSLFNDVGGDEQAVCP